MSVWRLNGVVHDTQIELGLDTFGDVTVDGDGQPLSQAQVLRNVVDQGVLADQVGLDFFGVGEHHRKDFSVRRPRSCSRRSPRRTTRIHLGSAVTVLSSDDPVRVFQRFSTLNAISNGRAEVIVGRGSFTESFPLFGYDLAHYEELFEEKLNLFAELLKRQPVTWTGQAARAAVEIRWSIRRSRRGTLRTWVGVGGSPESVVRAAHYGLPLMLAIIGGSPQRFAPLCRSCIGETLERFGKPLLPIGVHSPGHVAATDEQAQGGAVAALRRADEPHRRRARMGADRPRALRARGRPRRRAVRRLAGDRRREDRQRRCKALGLSRFDLKYSNGTLPHDKLMTSIELYGTKVVPLVRASLDLVASVGSPDRHVRRFALRAASPLPFVSAVTRIAAKPRAQALWGVWQVMTIVSPWVKNDMSDVKNRRDGFEETLSEVADAPSDRGPAGESPAAPRRRPGGERRQSRDRSRTRYYAIRRLQRQAAGSSHP